MTLKEFKEAYLGKQVEFHSYGANAYNQCVDLVNMYINVCLDNDTKDYTEIIGTNACDFESKYDPEDFDWIVNQTSPNIVPEEGDIVVWNSKVGGGAGHVAIFLDGDGNDFTSLDQNWSQAERVTVENHSYTNVSGWLRPKNMYQSQLAEMTANKDEWKEKARDAQKEVTELTKTILIYKDEINALESKIEALEKQLALGDEYDDAQEARIKALEAELSQEKVKYSKLVIDMDELQNTNDALSGRIKLLEQEIVSLKKEVGGVEVNSKSLFRSRTFWIGFLEVLGGILTAVSHDLASGAVISLMGVVQIVLRVVTSSSVSLPESVSKLIGK